jgi:hypothetical protein
VALVLLWPVTAMGVTFYTGSEIQEDCVGPQPGEANANVSKYNSCVMYLAGLTDAATTFSGWDHKNKRGAPQGSCIPKAVSQEQLRQVWLRYANQHPGKLHLTASGIALNAFEKAWPCKR